MSMLAMLFFVGFADTEIGGHTMKAGEMATIFLGSSNRYPRMGDDLHDLRLDREDPPGSVTWAWSTPLSWRGDRSARTAGWNAGLRRGNTLQVLKLSNSDPCLSGSSLDFKLSDQQDLLEALHVWG